MSESTNPFAELGLRAEIVETLTDLGYEVPTPIQERTIPLMLAARDLIGQAQTGTGKTAAFALPILEKIDPSLRDTQALVLTPTRELAMQVADAIHSYAVKLGPISVLPVYGGAPIFPQLKRLDRGAHIVVGTPGRLIDHLERGSLKLSKIRVLVLDEADEMLKMGFAEEVDKILAAVPEERQIALFSATMPEEVMRVAKRHLRNPERVEIEHRSVAAGAPAIEQRFLNVSEGQKLEVLTQILELQPAEAVLIFRRTKTGSAELAEKLEGRGFAAVAMHGDMTQSLRESVIRRLRAGQVEIVVATDVAARGLDVEQIEHVINYDVPYDVEAYVHRIGRTGRAGRSGLATMFITPRERKMMREIERYTGTQIKPMKMPTGADIVAKRIGVFKDTIRKTIAEGDLDMYVELVEQLVEEGPFDMADIAAAAARIANGSRALVKTREEETVERLETRKETRSDLPARRERVSHDDETHGDDDAEVTDKTITLSMSVGRANGIRPADVVGSIANEAGIPGREIGPIDIQEDVTYVGIPQRFVEVVLEKVGKARFRGRAVNLKVALPGTQTARRAAPRPDRDRDERPPRKYDRPAGTGFRKPAEGTGFRKPAEGSGFRNRSDERPPRDARPARDERPARDARPSSPRSYDRPRPSSSSGPRPAGSAAPRRPMASGPRDPAPISGPRDRVTRATGSGPRDHAAAPRRDDRLPGREYSPRPSKPFYSDVKKGGFKGKKRK
ncbi:MAG: DEAD/DEAH box helicase [Acidobacteriota bacterium]|nr:DEAD/DEAH box helicase [Acidobacteriota bacterium]